MLSKKYAAGCVAFIFEFRVSSSGIGNTFESPQDAERAVRILLVSGYMLIISGNIHGHRGNVRISNLRIAVVVSPEVNVVGENIRNSDG